MSRTLARPAVLFALALLCTVAVMSGGVLAAEPLDVAVPGSGYPGGRAPLALKSASFCDLLQEDFSGVSGNEWSYHANGTWFPEGGQLGVHEIPTGKWAVAETSFKLWDLFSVDIDVNVIAAPGIYDGVGLYAFTTGDTTFSLAGRSVDGVAVIVYPADDTMEFMAWDVNAGEWYSSGYHSIVSPLLSFGMSWESDRVVFRANGEDTTLSFSGDFSLAPESIDKLWILGKGTGTDVRFDNLCASSLGNGGGVARPSAPTNLRYTLNGSTFTLSWDAAVGAIGYNLGIGSSSGNYAAPQALGNTTQFGPLDISNVPAGTYYLAVKSVGSEGGSDYSNELAINWAPPVTALAAPGNIRYTLNDNIFTLFWDTVPGAWGYQLGLGVGLGFDAASYDDLGDMGNTTQFGPLNIAGLAAGTYHLAARAYGAAGIGPYSTDLPVTITGDGTQPIDTIFTFHTNPTDGELLSTEGVDGTAVHYFGERDDAGIPARVDRIQVVTADGETTSIELDENSRPAKMYAPNGVRFDLSYTGNIAAVTAVSPDGMTAANTTFPFETPQGSPESWAQSDPGLVRQSETDGAACLASKVSKAAAESVGDWIIKVNRCGYGTSVAWVDAWVEQSGASNRKLYPKSMGGGLYHASVPVIPPPGEPILSNEQIDSAVDKIEWVFDKTCLALGQASHPEVLLAAMCPYVGAALTTVTGPGGAAIGVGCEAVTVAVMTYCATLGQGPPGGDSAILRVIKQARYERDEAAADTTLHLWAQAQLPGSAPLLEEISAPATGPLPSLTLSADENCDKVLNGTWHGTWSGVGLSTVNGCNFTDGGDISLDLSGGSDVSNFYMGQVISASGIGYRWTTETPEHELCSLDRVESSSGGAVTAKRTGDSVNISFHLPTSGGDDTYTGTLQLSSSIASFAPNGLPLTENLLLRGPISAAWGARGFLTLQATVPFSGF